MNFNDNLLRAIRGEPIRAIWFMRQAGRYLSEYKKLREKYNIFEMIKNPEISAYITKLPVDKLNVDGAILFSDITIIFEPMGIDFEIVENKGPVIRKVLNEDDIRNLIIIEPFESLDFVYKTIKILKSELNVPLIGFSAGPFTLAVYLIEGTRSKDFLKIKEFMLKNPTLFDLLMEKLTINIYKFLEFQIKAGVDIIQIFDSWIGCLSPNIFKLFILKHIKNLVSKLKQYNIPIIYFSLNTYSILHILNELDVDVISIDWRIDIGKAREILKDKVIQGNLDPAILLADFEIIKKETMEILKSINYKHIFNLGHGILPNTPFINVKKLVDFVKEVKI
ncbi:MAG: uroporphyrinogen decarboxylase [candidate division WOR-3 bacterium]